MKQKNRVSLSKHLFSSFVISFLLPMALVNGLVSYLFSSRQQQEIHRQTANNTTLITAYISKYIGDIDNITKAPYYHSYFQSKTMVEDLTPYEHNQIGAEMGQLLQLTTYSRNDFGDMLILSNEQVIYFNTSDWYQYLPTVTPLAQRQWYTKAMEQGGPVAIVPVERQTTPDAPINTESFYISRRLNNIFWAQQTNIIMVSVSTDTLDELFSSLTSAVPLKILFTNDEGEPIYANTDVTTALVASLNQPSIAYAGSSWTNYSQTLERYPLTVHVLLDNSYVQEQVITFVLLTLLCYAVCVCFAYLLFRRNNHWIQEPTYHIKATLEDLEHGNLAARCQPLSVTEFQEIGLSINTMAHQLQDKIHNEYELRIAHDSLKFRALQSQIQPHFIINTIYSFISLNQIGEPDALGKALYSFARMLRYVLSKDDRTTIGRELNFLEDYCSLFLLRFGDRFSYTIHCDEAVHDLDLPKLLLQPLVENAVIHGIEPSETPCTLTLTVHLVENTLQIVIADNGVGFTPHQLHSENAIGIRNVETRLGLWNIAATLDICCEDGTTVQRLTIPLPPS